MLKRIAKRLLRRSQAHATPVAPRVEPPVVSPPAPEPAPQHCKMAGLSEIQALVRAPGRVRVVCHWATWCSGCIEELPVLVALHERLAGQAEFIGISWDAFQGNPGERELLRQVDACIKSHGMQWDSVVVDAEPDTFFSALDMSCHTVPQLWLVAADGQVIHEESQVLTMADLDGITERVLQTPRTA